MSDPTTNARYAIDYEGNPRSDAARLKTLKDDGPLVLAKEQMVNLLMPEAFDAASAANSVAASQRVMHDLILPGVKYDADMLKKGIHFAVGGPRLAKYMHDLDNDGFDMTPIYGRLEAAMPTAVRRFTEAMLKLPDDKRTLKLAEVWYDGSDEDAGTGTFYDWISIQGLLSGDGSPAVVAQLQSLTPRCFINNNSGGRGDDGFEGTLDQIKGAVGRDISSLSDQAQAAEVTV